MNPAPCRVLVIDDDPSDVTLIREMLDDSGSGSGVSVESADTLADAIQRLAVADIDVALLDLGLPDCQGLETFARLRDAVPPVAIVVLTDNSDVDLAVRAVKEGAQDFLMKGKVDGELLTRAIAYAVGRQQADEEVSRERALLAQAEEIAHLGSWRFELATGDMWWSDEMHRVFDIDPLDPPDDLIAAVDAALHPDDRGQGKWRAAHVITSGSVSSSQCRIITREGTVRWIATHSQPEHDAHGTITAIAGFAQDITAMKLAEERMAKDAAQDKAIAALSQAMLASDPSLDGLTDLVLDEAKTLTHSPIGLISPSDQTLMLDGSADKDGGPAVHLWRETCALLDTSADRSSEAHVSIGESVGWHSRFGEGFFVNSFGGNTELIGIPEEKACVTSCFLAVPAIAEERLVGHIAVADAPDGYSDEDLETVKRLAALYAIAIVGQEERGALIESESSLRQSNLKFERMVYRVSEAMGKIVEVRDPYTQGHEVRVAKLASSIAQEMQLSHDEINAIDMAGLVHDIGKLCVPAEILTKPGSLSDLEFAIMKEHPEAGHSILIGIEFPWPIADIVLAHHERLDGSGYPSGLIGDDIPLASRVLAVADVVEAMASHRPYRPALGLDAAVAELQSRPGTYDGDVVNAFLSLYESGRVDLQSVS